jgi:hypothetical protein
MQQNWMPPVPQEFKYITLVVDAARQVCEE